MSDNDEILPCRLCGGEGQPFCYDDAFPRIGPVTYAVTCEDCPNRGPIKPSEEESIMAWNLNQRQR